MTILGNFKNPFLCSGSPFIFGLYFSSAPLTDIIVSFSGGASIDAIADKTFTSSNYNIPQPVIVSSSLQRGMEKVTLVITAAGGEVSSETVVLYITYVANAANLYGTNRYLNDGIVKFKTRFPTITRANFATQRQEIKDYIFKGNYPSGNYYAQNLNPASLFDFTFANAKKGTVYDWRWRELDESGYYYENITAYIQNTDNLGKLFVLLTGHGELYHQEMYNEIMDQGWDILIVAMDRQSGDRPSYVAFPHPHYTLGIDTATFDGRRLFLFDGILAIQKVKTLRTYTQIDAMGVSGGAWKLCLWAAFDTDAGFDKVFLVRGTGNSWTTGGGDYEQGPRYFDVATGVSNESGPWTSSGPRLGAFYISYPYELLKCLIGDYAELHEVNHITDTTSWKGWYFQLFNHFLTEKIETDFGGFYHQEVLTNAAQATHGLQPDDRAYIISNL